MTHQVMRAHHRQHRMLRRMTESPFFEAWNTPFELPPFARIAPEHFPPAFDRGMAEHAAEIAAIAGSAESADFVNTIEALERSGALLRRVGRVFNHLTSSMTNPALDAIDRDYGGHGARSRWPLCDHPGARLGRAVPRLLGAPRPASGRLPGLGGARHPSRRAG